MQYVQHSQFLSPVSVFAQYLVSDNIWIEQYESYQKRSLRNRCTIMGVNGPLSITIPLQKGKTGKAITEVSIAYHDQWIGQCLHSIRSAYGTAAYFDHYYPSLSEMLKAQSESLYQLNMDLLVWLNKAIGIETPIKETESYQKSYPDAIDHRKLLIKDYPIEADSRLWYPQVFEDRHGFVYPLSILDLIFNTGPESILYLQQISTQL